MCGLVSLTWYKCCSWNYIFHVLTDIISHALSSCPSLYCAVLPALVDRLGDGKDQVRENSQALILRCMEQTASPMVRLVQKHRTQSNHSVRTKRRQNLLYYSISDIIRSETTSENKVFWIELRYIQPSSCNFSWNSCFSLSYDTFHFVLWDKTSKRKA